MNCQHTNPTPNGNTVESFSPPTSNITGKVSGYDGLQEEEEKMARFLSLKALLMSAGVVSMALALKVTVPLVFEFSVLHVPLIRNSLISCLKPPYIYIIINGIIISIVATSRFNQKKSDDAVQIPSEFTFVESPEVHEQRDEPIVSKMIAIDETDLQIEEVIAPIEAVISQSEEVIDPEAKVNEAIRSVEVEAENDDKFVILSNPICNPPVRKRLPEKPLVSSRFGHRESPKSSPEGGKAKRHETLENTWKAITEGRAMPLSRYMMKCETWENHGREINVGDVYSSPVNKSETFKDKTNIQALTPVNVSAQAMNLRKEPSLSQDDLNRRVEDFISRFNQEMRLQREQSLKKYWEMVNQGGHN